MNLLIFLSQFSPFDISGLRQPPIASEAEKVHKNRARYCSMMGMSFYVQGCRQAQRGKRQTGKWKHVRRPGVETVVRRQYKGWQIEIFSRLVGMTVSREQFSAVIRLGNTASQYLQNYHSKNAALEAAQQHIDIQEHTRRHVLPGPHQRANRPTSDRK